MIKYPPLSESFTIFKKMMLNKFNASLLIVLLGFNFLFSQTNGVNVKMIDDKNDQKIAIYMDDVLITNYLYTDQWKKPVLYPLNTASGITLTRGYPIDPRIDERADHPHQVGLWLNYGDVNGLDFWNNSNRIDREQLNHYGTIEHQKILKMDDEEGVLVVSAVWKNNSDQVLLSEETSFIFQKEGSNIIIDRISKLHVQQDIQFNDNKEGMLGIRVANELELPDKKATILIGKNGKPDRNKRVRSPLSSGDYLSSSGLTGNDVWGTRAQWVLLHGVVKGKKVGISIIDHPQNPGYPTYWHARGYGLFAANPLGQAVFSEGKEKLNFKLTKDQTITFSYRIILHEDQLPGKTNLDNYSTQFAHSNQP